MNDSQVTREEILIAFGKAQALMETPEKQSKIIETWERVWNETLPHVAGELSIFVAAIEADPDWQPTPDIAEGLAEIMRSLLQAIEICSSENAPNPDIVALHYLRRIETRLERIEHELGIRPSF